jgi:50S ribosomal protein L16 3-hydroxylase
MEEAPLGGLSANEFLQHYWQKRPLLVRGALPTLRSIIGKKSLFSLAARADVESRLVERRGKSWHVSHGPLQRADLSRLDRSPSGNWTLLVNGVNGHSEAADRLLRRFAFLSWARLDDVMVSYAAPGGGVGPHFDSYDVFLAQGEGRRLWRLARPRRFRLKAGVPLKLIEGFRAEEEYLLEPGDMLYLPPGWGHDGIALDACFTCSIGARAPRGAELGAAFLDYLHERGLPDAAYRDPRRRATRHPARIDPGLLAFARGPLRRIRWDEADITAFLGRYLTAPKPNVVFRRRSTRGDMAVLDPNTQLLYRGARFFINGEALPTRPAQRAALARLADERRAPWRWLARRGLQRILLQWREAGYLHLERRP